MDALTRADIPEAESTLHRAITLHGKLHGLDDPGLSDLWYNLYDLYMHLERWAEAERALVRSIRLIEAAPDDLSSVPCFVEDRAQDKGFHVSSLCLVHADVLERLGRNREADQVRRRGEEGLQQFSE